VITGFEVVRAENKTSMQETAAKEEEHPSTSAT
jgi:hypothetical protein